MAESLSAVLSPWSIFERRGLICHDATLMAYNNAMHMLEGGMWSIACTSTAFIRNARADIATSYICPVFACDGSTETRAVGEGAIQIKNNPGSGEYDGALGFYNKSIRGSVHSSGRCYDCEMAYRILCSMMTDNGEHAGTAETAAGDVKFVNTEPKSNF